jgi:DNA-binding MarR family transcriptional regulator
LIQSDHETRADRQDHDALRLWLRLLTCTNLIEAQIRTRLRDSFATTLPRFDLAAQLAREPDGLKMGELSRRLMVTGGNVTGLVDQLEADGFVARVDDPEDRRAIRIRLTKPGRAWFEDMAREHETWVVDLFGGLTAAERQQLFKLLARLKTTLKEPA